MAAASKKTMKKSQVLVRCLTVIFACTKTAWGPLLLFDCFDKLLNEISNK